MYITTIVHDSNNFAIGYSPLAKNLTYAYMINRHKLFAIFSGKTQLGSWIGDIEVIFLLESEFRTET